MHFFIIALFIGLHLASQPASAFTFTYLPDDALGLTLLCIGLPKLVLAIFFAFLCKHSYPRLTQAAGSRVYHQLNRSVVIYRLLLVILFYHDLSIGWLDLLHTGFGRWILVGDVLAITPTLALLAWSFYVYYPIDRRLREATILRQLDLGQPVRAIWSRRQYITAQLRLGVAMILLPLLLITAWSQCVQRFGPDLMQPKVGQWGGGWLDLTDPQSQQALIGLQFLGVIVIFVLAPLLIRVVMGTVALPAGPLRNDLIAMCNQYRIGIRQLLLWQTHGGIINAAVMGLFKPVRYILLSDGLVEMLPANAISAVMAHELAHVKHKHMLWLLITALALMMTLSLLAWPVEWALIYVAQQFCPPDSWVWPAQEMLRVLLVTLGIVASWLALFGWVSRRFERQADTFAVLHIAKQHQHPTQLSQEATACMVDALQHVADLNHINPYKNNWRHGSIAWRQQYLRRLAGQKADPLPIDQQVGHIKWAMIGALLANGLVMYFL